MTSIYRPQHTNQVISRRELIIFVLRCLRRCGIFLKFIFNSLCCLHVTSLGPERKVFYRPQSLSHHKANIWVVRYVDYTSKYGLDFLLNTGSSGVYFNDSTKIVASPDGTVFQYSERRKKEKGSTSSEHSIQTHFMSKYPSELQKKVTLLRHFRNYLVDQQKEGK
jgi:POLO box duplicated region